MKSILYTVIELKSRNSINKTIRIQFLILLILQLFVFSSIESLFAQPVFTKIILDDSVTNAGGVSWIDYDNDNDLDLYVTNARLADSNLTRDRLFRNDGNDNFVQILGQDMTEFKTHSRGISWADYNNDGNTDAFISCRNFLLNTNLGSTLYQNEGSGLFNLLLNGDIGAENTYSGMGAAWGDYNNDGFVDLFMATTKALAYPNDTLSNILFDNNKNGTFTKNTTSTVVNDGYNYYTMPLWSDFDQDGDLDLFISAGPVQSGNLQPDFFYKNLLIENGTGEFERDLVSSYAYQPRDGQEIQWIDFDNDRDLDLYITNYGGTPGQTPGMKNDFYRNDNGAYTKITTGRLATDIDISLGQVWGDFDNDGDIDLYTCNQTSFSNTEGGHRYYRNNGSPDYTFTRINSGDFVNTNRIGWGACAGDYDNDGDLDLYVTLNTFTNAPDYDALYKNELNNSNNWVNIVLEGKKTDASSTGSNRSGIGAIVYAKALISGIPTWQMREVSTNSGFSGQNSLRVHFGFGNAVNIDSLIIKWPSGITNIFTDVAVNNFYKAKEDEQIQIITSVEEEKSEINLNDFHIFQNYPNPFNPSTTIRFSLNHKAFVSLKIYNVNGELIKTLVEDNKDTGTHSTVWDGQNEVGIMQSSGVYFYKLASEGFSRINKMILVK